MPAKAKSRASDSCAPPAVRLCARVTVPLLPKRALVLAQEILTRGVQAIKANQWGAA